MRNVLPAVAFNISRPWISRPRLILCAAAFWLAVSPCSAQEQQPLSAWVPDDVGAYLEVRGIRRQWDKFCSGSQFARLAAFPPWQSWRDKETSGLKQISAQIAAYFGVETAELWEKVLGHDLAIAIWPAADRDRDKAPAVLIVRAADAEALQQVATGFRLAQERYEQARWKTAAHAGIEYSIGVRPGEKPPVYLAVVGTIGLLSESEDQFRAILATRASGKSQTLAQLPAFQMATRSVPESAMLSLFVNPRPWEKLLQAEVTAAPVERRSEKEAVLQAWRALNFAVASFELDPRLRLQLVVKYQNGKLPEAVRDLAEAFAGPTTFLDSVPDDCLLAAAGRLDLDLLVRWAVKHAGAEHETGTSQLFVRALRMLGPDAGAYLRRRDRGTVNEGLLDWVAAVHVSPRLRELLPDAEDLLRRVLPTFVGGIAKAQDSVLFHLTGLLLDGRRLVEDGVRAASGEMSFSLAFSTGRLWAGASDAALQRSKTLPVVQSLAKSARWKSHLSQLLQEPNYALFIDCAGWRSLLTQHRDELLDTLARERSMDRDSAQRSFRQLLSLLALADTVAAAVKSDEGTLAISFSAAVDAK